MNTEQLRADFEAWAKTHYYLSELGLDFENDEYADMEVQGAFEAYQAGRAALQSQDREDAAYESGRRCGLGFAHSVVSEILRKHYYGSGVEGLSKLVQQAADALAMEINNPTTATTGIDHARRIEGDGE